MLSLHLVVYLVFIQDLKMDHDEEIEGFRVVAEALKKLGVKYMFGVVGIPVVEVSFFFSKEFSEFDCAIYIQDR